MCFSALQRAENSSIPRPSRRAPQAARVSVLFSEPKIPQSVLAALSPVNDPRFQCSSASRKFLNSTHPEGFVSSVSVSVLFSEPKIPQSRDALLLLSLFRGFSALQRAENSSIFILLTILARARGFSALQRAENSSMLEALNGPVVPACFSALQRAENSSMR